MSLTIWHNPGCSTSRHVLALLDARGHAPTIVEYLKTPPSTAQIGRVLKLMGAGPEAILRTRSAPPEAMAAWAGATTARAKIAALAAYPILIERPIVITEDQAALARPKAHAEDILDGLSL